MKIVGYRKSDFKAKDGNEVKGYNVFFESPITAGGKGVQTEKVYLSEGKLAKMGVNLNEIFGKEVSLSYNRWGKVEQINVLPQ